MGNALLRQGSIVWVTVADSEGRNPQRRPAVVVSPDEHISAGESIVLVAATSTFPEPLPENCVELPWQHTRHPKTKLYKRCVAVCDWLIEIEQQAVERVGGYVPKHLLQEILNRLPSTEPEEDDD